MKTLAKEILTEIVRHSGGVFEGKTRLFKAFYFAHLFYFESTNGQVLSEHPIVHMPEGPGIAGGDKLIRELAKDGVFEIYSQRKGPYPQEVYRLIGNEDTSLDQVSIAAIKQACVFVEGRSGSELSAITHDESRSWKNTANGEDMTIYQDVLTDDEFEEQRQRIAEARQALQTALDSPKS